MQPIQPCYSVGHGGFITFAPTTKWQQETAIKKKSSKTSQIKISRVRGKWKWKN